MAPSWRTCASAKGMTDAEVLAAAEYFAALKPKRIIKVVESETIPKTGPSRLFYVKSPEGGTEPLGQRIVEMPDDVDQFELRDSRATFTAYVPVGSVAKGETLAKTGGSGTTITCSICHGRKLKGVGPIPPIGNLTYASSITKEGSATIIIGSGRCNIAAGPAG